MDNTVQQQTASSGYRIIPGGQACLDVDLEREDDPEPIDQRLQSLATRVISGRAGFQNPAHIWIGQPNMEVEGLDGFGAIWAYRHILILPDQPVAVYLTDLIRSRKSSIERLIYPSVAYVIFRQIGLLRRAETIRAEQLLQQISAEMPNMVLGSKLNQGIGIGCLF